MWRLEHQEQWGHFRCSAAIESKVVPVRWFDWRYYRLAGQLRCVSYAMKSQSIFSFPFVIQFVRPYAAFPRAPKEIIKSVNKSHCFTKCLIQLISNLCTQFLTPIYSISWFIENLKCPTIFQGHWLLVNRYMSHVNDIIAFGSYSMDVRIYSKTMQGLIYK